MILAYFTLIVLIVISFLVTYYAWRTRKAVSTGNNPEFLSFQRTYFAAYLLALVADWLQGPYLYRLYVYYGFDQSQIAVLYVCGFASVVGLGTWAPFLVNNYGRRKLCILCSIVYSISCLMKISRSYVVLIVGRIFGGLATSLLFTAYEAWYMHEHTQVHDFPSEWIPVTSRKLAVWNSVLAVVAGFTANIIAEWLSAGPLAPFILAVPFLLASGVIVGLKWSENTGQDPLKFGRACRDGIREIVDSSKIMLLGAIQSLFESVLHIVVFIWTPVLSSDKTSYGVVFSTFMLCVLIGTGFQELYTRKFDNPRCLLLSVILAGISMISCSVFASPQPSIPEPRYLSLLIYEFSVGIYFAAMGKLREKIIPENHTVSIMNWFRVPLNIIACIVLMLLHDEAFRHGNRLIFIICSCLLLFCTFCCLRLSKLIENNQDAQDEVFVEGES